MTNDSERYGLAWGGGMFFSAIVGVICWTWEKVRNWGKAEELFGVEGKHQGK